MKEFFRECRAWLANEDNRGRVGVLATVALLVIASVHTIITSGTVPPPGGEVRLSVEDFQALLEEREQQGEQRLAQAHGDERRLLENELTEVKRQLANIEPAYTEALQQIRELEPALARLSDDSSDTQRAEIRAALETGDFSQADAVLAEIAARTDGAVGRAAAAAFQRGHIAAMQIKWGEAATHFDTAARLKPTDAHLNAAGIFAARAAQYKPALRHFEKLLELSHREHGERSPETARVLNNLARVLRATGRYAEAEPLYRHALEIDRTTRGEEYPASVASLNNLAHVLRATGQYAEAGPLYQQAVEIVRTALGDEHPHTRRLAGNYGRLLRARFPDNPVLAELNAVLGEEVNED